MTPNAQHNIVIDELERLLNILLDDQRRLLDLLKQHRAAMIALDADATARISAEQEKLRSRLASVETRRKALSLQVAREMRVPLAPDTLPTITQLVAHINDKPRQTRLLAIRDELRVLVGEVSAASHVASRLAGGVLGHLNTALRLISTAMRDAGTYTKSGAPRVGARIGNLEAVG